MRKLQFEWDEARNRENPAWSSSGRPRSSRERSIRRWSVACSTFTPRGFN